MNIVSEGAPVKASGLTSELGIQNIDAFALEVMKRYSEEIDDIKMASNKSSWSIKWETNLATKNI